MVFPIIAGAIGAASVAWTLITGAVAVSSVVELGSGLVHLPNSGILDATLALVKEICDLSVDTTLKYARNLLFYMMFFDLFFSALQSLLSDGSNPISMLINKILKYGFWLFVLTNWKYLASTVVESLAIVGGVGDSGSNIGNFISHPSAIIDKGIDMASGFMSLGLKETLTLSSLLKGSFFGILFQMVLVVLGSISVFFAFFIVAINVITCMIEFHILSSLMLIFIPLCVFEKTEKFGSQCINLVVATGAKVMVTIFVTGIMMQFFDVEGSKNLFSFKDKTDLSPALFAIGICLLWTYISCEIPAMAQNLLSGSLSLSFHGASGHAMAAMYKTQQMVSMGKSAASAATAGMGMQASIADKFMGTEKNNSETVAKMGSVGRYAFEAGKKAIDKAQR